MKLEFKGTFTHTIDHKGRVSIPSSLRRMLPQKGRGALTMTQGLDGCLFLYPKVEWEGVKEKLRKLSFLKANNRRFTRKFLAKCYDVEIDTQGRIKIPQDLVEVAGLEKEALFLGLLDKIEVWNPHVYSKYITEGEGTLEDDAERVLFPGEVEKD